MEFSNKTIDDLLVKFKSLIGEDYGKYRNHVYRIFLNCLLIDSKKDNEEKYAIAAVFHDIGIWTNHNFDYLDPSIEQAKIYLLETGKQNWIDEITRMIYWHHKITKYHGDHEIITENFRKADWIDVSLGLLNFGVDKQRIKENKKALPNLGFHIFLVKGIIKDFLNHPLNPLPMFKK
jgi:hypothetical protein